MGDCFSPWKKPSDVMKLRRKKRRLENQRLNDSKRIKLLEKEKQNENLKNGRISSSTNFELAGSFDSPLLRSKNPFRRNSLELSALISRKNFINEKNESTKQNLLDALDQQDSINNNQSVSSVLETSRRKLRKHLSATYKQHESFDSSFDFSQELEKTSSFEFSPFLENQEYGCSLPVDWSVKQKLRIISIQSFDWCKHLKTSEEADGIRHFMQKPHTQLEPIKMKEMKVDQWKSIFQKECLYWIHPNLPWMKMFPRIQNEKSLQNLSLCDKIYDSLQADWSSSFHSVFGQLKSGHCPYFYFCTHQLSVLFRRISPTASLSAVITPTTRGIREALTSEGIQYKMPFDFRNSEKSFKKTEETSPKNVQNISQESCTSPNVDDLDGEMDLFDDVDDNSGVSDGKSQNDENVSLDLGVAPENPDEDVLKEDEEDDSFAADDGAAVWLESMGLDKNNFPNLDPRRVKLTRDGFKKIDSRPESTLVLETDIDVNALFNFLLNWKSCFAAAGPQFRIPPTILAPTGFKGAVMKSMSVKHSNVFLPEENEKGHVLEIVGPLLPCHVQGFIKLFYQTQAKQFSMALNTHESMSPFNVPVDNIKNGEQNSFDDKANSIHFLNFKTLRSITQLKCNPSGFTWS